MKLFKIVGGIFSIIGIGALIGVAVSIVSTNNFISNSLIANGRIVDIVTKTNRDSDGNATRSRYPVIQFQEKNGTTIEFESSSSTSGGISIGENVEVRYLPENPKKAKISSSFMDVWGLSVFLGIFGVVFTGLGIPFFWLGIRDSINEKNALRYSKEITARIKEVVQNTSISMNGRCPFVIEAQWLNPDTNEIHIFKSKNFWYDPSEYLKDDIIVKMDPRNMKKYWMDVSFLPKKAPTV